MAVCVLVSLCAAEIHAQPDERLAEIDALRVALAQRPEDADVRLTLAVRLAWQGARDEARALALDVIERAPAAWDAHLLVARIDGWQGRYDQALTRVKAVHRSAPHSREALLLWADLGIWSRRLYEARAALDALDELGADADVYYRRAQVAELSLRPLAAHRMAHRALALDSEHEGARRILHGVRMLGVHAAGEVEIQPAGDPDRSIGLGHTAAVTFLPRALVSLTASYDYRRRFATNNHRLGLRGDWRVTSRVTAWGAFAAGSVEVVPASTTAAGAHYHASDRIGASIEYTWDRMPWPGALHRLQPAVEARLGGDVRLGAAYALGLLRSCRRSELGHAARTRVAWAPHPIELGLSYAYAIEVERALLDVLGGDIATDACPPDSAPLLPRARVHALGVDLAGTASGSTMLRGGYSAELRPSGTVHIFHLAFRRWF